MNLRFLPGRLRPDRFGVRLGLILTMALAPVGIIALVQSAGFHDQLRARTEAALSGEVLHGAAPKLRRIADAQGMARGLAAQMGGLSPEACTALMQGLAGEGRPYALAAFYAADGSAICTSSPLLPDLTAQPFFAGLAQNSAQSPDGVLAMARPNPDGPADFLIALSPVTRDGQPAGFVAIAPQRQTASLEPGETEASGFVVMLFDRAGTILSANTSMDHVLPLVPRERTLASMFGRAEGMFTMAGAGGDRRIYSLNILIPDEIYALGTWPDQRSPAETVNAFSPLLLPAVMWAVSLLAAWIAAELMVTRHMRRLRRAITAFAQDHRRIGRLDLSHAPVEIRQAGDAFIQMTETILRDEAELEDSLRERETLLREVHHRVKNNLQLMASIINLQLRRTRSDEAKAVMRGLQDRMLSLATIHNSLFHTASLTEVEIRPLFTGMVDQIVVSGAGAGQRFEISSRFPPLSMSPEQLVPLALLLTEALGMAMKRAAGTSAAPQIAVSLDRTDTGDMLLKVVSPTPDDEECDEQSREDEALGKQLIHAFALQLGGSYRRNQTGGRMVQTAEFRLIDTPVAMTTATPQG